MASRPQVPSDHCLGPRARRTPRTGYRTLRTLLWACGATILALSPALAADAPIVFSATGDVPYGDSEVAVFQGQIEDHNVYSPSDFFVHLGDIFSGSESCSESRYQRVADIMHMLTVPAYVVPGDNETIDCSSPSSGWQLWFKYFLRFEDYFCGTPLTERQTGRQENFAFVENGVLFVGINLLGGNNDTKIMQDDAAWASQQLTAKKSSVRAAVFFAQAGPGDNHSTFFNPFVTAAAGFGKPILYIHGNDHAWTYDHPFSGAPKVLRVCVEAGGSAPPVQVTVTLDMTSTTTAFQFNRDPWKSQTPYNRAPCVGAGPDKSVALGSSVTLTGEATDNWVPYNPPRLTYAWSKVSGPGTVSFSTPTSLSTTAGFSTSGTYVIRLTANDTKLSGSDDVTVTVTGSGSNQAPVAANDSYSVVANNTLTVATPGVLTNDSDPDGDPLTASLVSSPGHGSLTLNSNGSFNYTPASSFTGTDTFTYQARDPGGLASNATVTIQVTSTPNRSPVAVNDSYSLNEDASLTLAAPGVLGNDSDPDGDPLSATVASGPAHGSLTLQSTGAFTYTPAANYNGSDAFTYTAADGHGGTAVATVTLGIAARPDPPVAVADAYSVVENNNLVTPAPGVLGNDTDPDGDALTATVVSTTTHGSLTLNANGSFAYTPVADFVGTDGFTYRASDPGGSASTASVTLQVTPPPPLALTFTPVADAYVSSFRSGNNYGTSSSILVRNSNQHDYQGYLRFSVSGMTGTLTSATLRLYVTDGGSDAGGCYAVSNNYAGTSTPWTETGITWNNAPVIGGSPLASLGSASAGVWKEVDVTASIAGNGTYCYGLLTSSSDEVDFNSREASSNPPQLVLLQQSPSGNTPPVAGADSYSVSEDNLLSVAAPGVLGNDTDADGDPLVVAANGAPAHGTLSMAANGSFTYTPQADYHGADSFTYTAGDGRGGTATGTVSLNVISVNDPPVARADSWTATAGQTLAVAAPGVLANDTDVDGDALSAVLVSGVAHGSLTLNPNGSFSYTPAAGFSGGDAFSYRASDGSAQSASATVTLTVSGSGTAAPVVFQEIQSGGSTGTATVTTSAALAAVTGHLYVAAIAAKPSPTVTGVSGLGLAWTRVRAQCGGRAQTGVEVWIGRGTPTAGTVTATLQSAATNAVIQVTRYSGVDPTNPVGNVLSGNTLGLNGACSGGVDGASFAFDLSTSPGSLALAAVVSRSKTLTPGAGYALRGQIFQGADAGSMASVATIDKTAAAATTVVDGTFNSTTDWAVVAVEIRPRPAAEQAALASRQDAPDAAALRPPGAVTVRIHPNPFTQGTSIDCELPTEAHADASVYSVRGQRVRTLASGRRAAGSWPLHWDGRSDRGDGLGAGIYFLHLRIAGVDHEYKLVLLK